MSKSIFEEFFSGLNGENDSGDEEPVEFDSDEESSSLADRLAGILERRRAESLFTAELSDIKKLILRLSDEEILDILNIPDKESDTKETDAGTKKWFYSLPSGLDKDGEKELAKLEKQSNEPFSSRSVDQKRLRYLRQLKKMSLEVPSFFRETVDPKALYKRLLDFCMENDIPEEIVSRVLPTLVTYIETGHMRPIIFVGEKGCGKTTAVKMFVKEALRIPTEKINVPQATGSYGLVGYCSAYQSADVGCIAKARLKNNSLLVAYIFDEVDKVSRDVYHAGIDDELLSITDEDCSEVVDNYLETRLVGLEHCPMFFTANDLQKVSPILADRCTVIHFPNPSAFRIKSISRKYANKTLTDGLHDSIYFDYELMDKHIDSLVKHGITSLRKHQQMIDTVIENAFKHALTQEEDGIILTTEEMFADAEYAIFGTLKHQTGFR
ncbi:MAG: ATP-binding protein [Oscillospiraceae bacterium]|nr:ATP-binding protein [Oscillospiraceae bacterium]